MKNLKITPEMIEAGVAVWCSSNEDFECAEDIVTNIFEAMMDARSQLERQPNWADGMTPTSSRAVE